MLGELFPTELQATVFIFTFFAPTPKKGSYCRPGTLLKDQAGLKKSRDPPASASGVLAFLYYLVLVLKSWAKLVSNWFIAGIKAFNLGVAHTD